MLSRVATLVTLCSLLLVGEERAVAGGVHIRYGPDAPEKMAALNLLYYEGVLNLEHRHPIAFAREHPFYTEMFHNPAMMDRLVARWEAHEQRFEYWHDCLWKVLDGYVVSHRERPVHLATTTGGFRWPGGFGIGGPSDVGGPTFIPIEPEGNPPDTRGGDGGGGGGVTALAVPEPSIGILIVTGALLVGSRVIWRRWYASSSRRRRRADLVLS
jgi:hypothetical protein